MAEMRAKLRVSLVEPHVQSECETVHFTAVAKNDGYPHDGADENNTYAKFTPSADLKMMINNPALVGNHKVGDEYYLDFTKA